MLQQVGVRSEMQIKYRPNYQKALEAIVYIANKKPGSGFHSILKTLYYADKFHLQRHGRPVLGDSYIKMSFGPVGSVAYDILKKGDFLPSEFAAESQNALEIRYGNTPSVLPKRLPDTSFFSPSDLACMEEALAFCEKKGFDALTEMTHQEPAWIRADMNREMDYELIIDEDIEHRCELLEHVRQTSATIAL
jgi:uncharacterized phage-associated protein